jgi:hypothetical protein
MYVTLTGGELVEYTTKNEFPQEGETNIVYLDQSTGLQYAWGIIVSDEELAQLREEKNNIVAQNSAQIDQLNEEIKTLNKEIKNLKSETDIKNNLLDISKTIQSDLNNKLTKEQEEHSKLNNELQVETELLNSMKEGVSQILIDLNQPVDWVDPIGRYGKGNIDLYNRPQIEMENGSIATVMSLGFYDDRINKEVLVTMVTEKGILTEDEAIDYYYETGKYLGYFNSVEESNQYA